ncbi:MAG TPA: DUF1501 domain-containing protein [Blastocatellia bacterium]|nr:DUF1501 domain-containing protein [Blastocatellia bacterium]
MPTTRRQFIKQGAGMVTVGMVLPRIWLGEAQGRPAAPSNRKFVVIQLAGGNDGFNTVVPYTESRYYALRPTLALREAELKDDQNRSTIITNQFGLHPALSEIKALYDEGKVAAVLGVGYPNPSLSHFLSMDIWHTADLSGLAGQGWLGRYADLALFGQPGLTAAAVGGELPKGLYANRVVIPNIVNFSFYNFLTDPAYGDDRNNQLNTFNAAASRTFGADTLSASINKTAFESVSGAQAVQSAVGTYHSSVVYPQNNPLADGLKMVAQLMTTIPEAGLLYVQMGGFDTHSDQIAHSSGNANRLGGWHTTLLKWFSEGVRAFYDDLAEHGIAEDVLIMEWSEFGRRPGENASFGTDHGTVGQMFIIGDAVRGGLHGEQPSLAASALDPAGNPMFTVDFREVYATILDRWLGVDSRAVLGAQFPPLDFLS